MFTTDCRGRSVSIKKEANDAFESEHEHYHEADIELNLNAIELETGTLLSIEWGIPVSCVVGERLRGV